MNILILGSGGREHCLAWKILQSPLLKKLFIAPGNAGTLECGINVDLKITDFDAIKQFIVSNAIDMLIVGPEDPLVKGIHDFVLSTKEISHISVIGPVKTGAMLEGSKDFAKQFMTRHSIPTAKYFSCNVDNIEEGLSFLNALKPPYVLKADGLAAGKGVLIIHEINEARTALKEMIRGKFGESSRIVVIEEFMKGIEVSFFALTDGTNYILLPEAKDYKRIGVNDTGLNTGGMGAVSPVPFADKQFYKKVEERIIIPTINGLRNDGIVYKGFIYFGLMNVGGEPWVVEYNARMGDPETEVVLPRIKNDLLEVFIAVANNTLNTITLQIDERAAATVVLVSKGYPQEYEKNKEITGFKGINESMIFHAGTNYENGKIFTSGGRVLAITSFGDTIEQAVNTSISVAEKINYQGKYFRNDIGFDLI